MRRLTIMLILAAMMAAPAEAQEAVKLDFSRPAIERVLERASGRTASLEVPRCDGPPTVDGQVDDAEWRSATRLSIPAEGEGTPATHGFICYDDAALYVAVACEPALGQGPVATPHERDAGAWRDDCIELWIDTAGEGKAVYQFIVSAAGAIYDAGPAGTGHDPEWRHAASVTADGWSVEMALPPAALELQAWPSSLGFNIGRNGPSIDPRAFAGGYGDTGQARLKLVGIEGAGDESAAPPTDQALELRFERTAARPGDRWIEGEVLLGLPVARLAGAQVRATLIGGDGSTLGEASVAPVRQRGRVLADLRTADVSAATVRVELSEGGTRLAQAEVALSAQEPAETLQPGQRIAITLDAPEGAGALTGWPVTFGVPFAPGALWDVGRLRLVDGQGRALPHQMEVAGRWAPEGAIKWVRVDALVTPADGCFVEVAPAAAHEGAALTLTPSADGTITVTNGEWRYVLGRGASPLMRIEGDGRVFATAEGTRGLFVIDQQGRTASASAEGETMVVEASGPVAACVRFEGPYVTEDGEELARHITRVEARAGQPWVDVTHTLVLTRDTNEVWFRDIGWELQTENVGQATALFATSREDPTESVRAELAPGDAAYMLQDSHYRFAHGENHFQAAHGRGEGRGTMLAEGEECGDWAALVSAEGGLAVSCRESALQHPKEFEARPDRLIMHLFSGRGGEELDFRPETLAEKWDLPTWYDTVISRAHKLPPDEVMEKMRAHNSNAIGWAKTHDLRWAPLTAEQDSAARVPAISRLHTQPVLALADPAWTCATGAMKPMHPRDPERFPEIETAIETAIRQWHDRIASWGDYGFVDYYAGPHLGYRGNYVDQKRYTGITYTLRPDLWLMYARSGDRDTLRFVADSVRTDFDGASAHFDGPNKTAGLFIADSGSDLPIGGVRKGQLPFYWETATTPHISSSTTMNNYAWYYYLTGYRRAADYIHEYNAGIKRLWTPARANRDARQLVLMRMLVGGYAFTWDPELRAMAEATFDAIHRPEAPLGFIQERGNFDQPYSTTYKTQVDIRGLLEAWEVLGSPRYYESAMRLSRWLWMSYLGDWPLVYTNPLGITGAFLHDETGDPRYAQGLAIAVRQAASGYDPETGTMYGADSAEKMTFLLEGVSHAQRVLVGTGADREPVASWAGLEDFGNRSGFVFRKPEGRALNFDICTPEGFRVIPAGADADEHEGLPWLKQETYEARSIAVPADAPAGEYEIVADTFGQQMVVADARVPLVIHAADYWRPAPPQSPPVRYYFRVPDGAEAPRIVFEGSARLYAPNGGVWPNDEPQHGLVELPADRPGLWAFEPHDNQLVRAWNVPPFFAVGDPEAYFEPAAIEWSAEEAEEIAERPTATGFVEGASGEEGDEALYIPARGRITIEGGEPHPSGDGRQFLPMNEGTIEFWFRPDWSTVDLPLKGKTILRMPAEGGEAWYLSYNMTERQRDANLDFYLSHVLYGYFMAQAPEIQHSMRAYRRTVFNANEWVHIAWVWGPRDGIRARDPGYNTRPQENVLIAQLYVNGRRGQHFNYAWKDNVPAFEPTSLTMYGLDAAVDELRLSSVQRYMDDFTPPARGARFEADEHTRLLLHFDGELSGEGAGFRGEAPLIVE